MNAETSDTIASIAGAYLHFGQADLLQAAAAGNNDGAAKLVTAIRALAASALRQHEPDETVPVFETKRDIVIALGDLVTYARANLSSEDPDLLKRSNQALMQLANESDGLKVNLIDVFSSWGAREAQDTAMLMDLCLGAAIEQLVPFTVPDDMWPAQVEIDGRALERIASERRISRLQPGVGKWRVRLLAPAEDSESEKIPFNPEWGKLGWIRRHIAAFEHYHSYYETLADSQGEGGSTTYHEERRKLGQALLAVLDSHITAPDAPPKPVPGEKAATTTVHIAEGTGKKKRK